MTARVDGRSSARSIPWRIVATWRGVLARWGLALLAIGGPLLWMQLRTMPDDQTASLQAIALVLASGFVAPVLWRLLVADVNGTASRAAGFVTYVASAVLAAWLTTLPDAGWDGLLWVLRSLDPGFAFAVGLYVVAGYALARDVVQGELLATERARVQALALEAEHAELMAIRTHLDPHFLFNTLNAIAEWCHDDPKVAEEAILRLSGMLQTVLAAIREPTWPLRDDLRLATDLGALYALRDPSRFALDVEPCPAALEDTQVPPMLALSLVENALKHGPGAGHQGRLRLRVEANTDDAGGLRLTLENPGPYAGPRPGGRGLELLRRRLRLVYGDRASLDLRAVGDCTEATAILPALKRG